MNVMAAFLEELGIEFREDCWGNQSVLCPFHEDRTKSATVNLDKELFFCFACGAAGDVITLLIEEKGMTYADSVKRAQALAGGADGEVQHGSPGESGDSFLPTRTGHRPGRRNYRSPWARH